MGVFRMPWGLTGALLATPYLHSICASASPSIKVGLKASFSSAPYLLELLETAADENSTSYFPLLDRIAEGLFSKATTDKELYEQFIQVLQDDGHMREPETLASYKFALSMRSAAPRIEAHYQYYHTAAEPSLKGEQDTSCPIWVLFGEEQFCSPTLDQAHGKVVKGSQEQELPFDRVLGKPTAPASILYADITSPNFGKFHKTLVKTAREGKTSYRVRHRKSLTAVSNPLSVPGYGVELALKRTDYIVIDDREDEDSKLSAVPEKEVKFDDEEITDLKPLSSSEVFGLAVKASSFIMQSEDPLEALVKVSQDFPKYSSAIASQNATVEFLAEHEYNRAQFVPAGYNAIWMNGVQLIERQIEALDLLDIMRKERTLLDGVRELGLTSPEAISLLGHKKIGEVRVESEAQRYDWRDEAEGGNVIIWMNDIEKDKRYKDWPEQLAAFLQRSLPGQLPMVRKDTFNLIMPVNFADADDVELVTDTLASFVKRKLNLRIGLVPMTNTIQSQEQARVLYYLLDTYGLQSVIAYLEVSLKTKKTAAPSKSSFETAIEGRNVKTDKTATPVVDLLKSDAFQEQVQASKKWNRRLAADGKVPSIFIDGVALPRNENWLQAMSTQVTTDLQSLQQAIYMETFTEESWLPSHFLGKAAPRRNALIVPEDDKSLRMIDVHKFATEHQGILDTMPRINAEESSNKAEWAYMVLVVDLDSESGAKLLATTVAMRDMNSAIELIIIHNPTSGSEHLGVSADLFSHVRDNSFQAFPSINKLTAILSGDGQGDEASASASQAEKYWQTASPLRTTLNLLPGQNAIMLNGRLVGPIPADSEFDTDDMDTLLSYERSKRITPAYAAIEALKLTEKVETPLGAAKISSIVALATISDTPGGIFEEASTLRMADPQVWNSTYTAIEVGDKKTATFQFLALVDPASTQAQRWIPILKVLSGLDGVYMKLYLNPKERLTELPVKRFYRYVLDSKPTFDDAGAVKALGASFTGVPQEALLTVGLDIPPAWLVAPKVSVHDLDNIKLSSIKTDVEAVYELEHILIEGHSREMPSGSAPRGAQLVLGTERDAHIGDTIIMANLGYFQFKANPGYYNIHLQEGRSSEIFHIDSLGSNGWRPIPGNENADVVLMSFKGTTLYPRLSRKAGMEEEDVLEAKAESKVDSVLSKGLNFAQGILGNKPKPAAAAVETATPNAEINIFSVASGHLYERMLNIMMVSVMKNTKHTVKFWFIEQFLSPSFKDFIPSLAAEYGFQYEMVTYKWPHWLRAQTEKQREIWGYKILFLDVLFPLSLDKVIFVDADQIVRTDMIDLVNHDLKGAPYGFTPMCDSRTEMEGFRFWKQGYWKNFLKGLPYHISALYVVDLHRFRQIAAGDRLRQQYHALSADPNSLSNLDQDLPNHMQNILPIHSLPQEWLWCETWCSDEALKEARTIDLCNNPQTKEPKLDRARRQVPEWTVYDDEIAAVAKRRREGVGARGEKNTKSRTLEERVVTSSKKDEL